MRRSRLAPARYSTPQQVHVCMAISPECVGHELSALDDAVASSAWNADLLIYMPLVLPVRTNVAKLFWFNGSSVNGTADVGIYAEDGTKLVSTGATTQAGVTTIQVVDVADIMLAHDTLYWLAFGGSSSTGTYTSYLPPSQVLDFIGVKQQVAGYAAGLPATPAFDATCSQGKLPIFGFCTTANL